ncbi:MAG: polyphosphate kinase 2 family protein [Verrucomicrobiaceae bacterium]|nr:MAG: polyphosphate kinase 2 family protein [Verrucomicrobiaceae bacterium]
MTLDIDVEDFRCTGNEKLNLKKRPTALKKPLHDSKEELVAKLRKYQEEIDERQQQMFAQDQYAMLLVFQAMDAAGKDGTIKHVMSGINPHGVEVHAFKQPSLEELDHDFLWRSNRALPGRGKIGIFNRSYYEEVLVVRVHPKILQGQRLPPSTLKSLPKLWEQRYQAIRNFEKHQTENGMRIVKFFLHVSKDEQKKRFLERIDNPSKNWKFNDADLKERACWDDYQEAYHDAIAATATKHSPWYIIPADDKGDMRLLVSAAILAEMKHLNLEWPVLSKDQQLGLAACREALIKE